jgi:hypothetical protein
MVEATCLGPLCRSALVLTDVLAQSPTARSFSPTVSSNSLSRCLYFSELSERNSSSRSVVTCAIFQGRFRLQYGAERIRGISPCFFRCRNAVGRLPKTNAGRRHSVRRHSCVLDFHSRQPWPRSYDSWIQAGVLTAVVFGSPQVGLEVQEEGEVLDGLSRPVSPALQRLCNYCCACCTFLDSSLGDNRER